MINRILTFINRVLFNNVKVDIKIPVKHNVGKMSVALISSTGHRFGDIIIEGYVSRMDYGDLGVYISVKTAEELMKKMINESKTFEVSPGRFINRDKVERFEVGKIEDYLWRFSGKRN